MNAATADQKNYLGHPCQLAYPIHRFSEAIEESRKQDARALAQGIGRSLEQQVDRCEHAHDVAELALSIADRSTDDQQLVGLLNMLIAYTRESCDRAQDLAGGVLDALQRADFVRPSQSQTNGAPDSSGR